MELTPKVKPAEPKYGVLNLHGASGNAFTVIGWLGDGKAGTPNYVALNGNNAIAADAGGPQTWGNQDAIDGAQRSYNRLQSMPGTKPGKVFIIGASMGGLTALNWAAQNPEKVAAIAIVVPVINLADIKANNRGGYAGLVDAAYGGNYSESIKGATHNPATIADSGKFSDIPILIYYGLTDTVCVPAETESFAADVGSNVTLMPLPYGHDDNSYRAVSNQVIIDFFNAHADTE